MSGQLVKEIADIELEDLVFYLIRIPFDIVDIRSELLDLGHYGFKRIRQEV